MGTVIVFEGSAYVFPQDGPKEALQTFFTDWFPNAGTGIQVYPLGGTEKTSEAKSYSGPWVEKAKGS